MKKTTITLLFIATILLSFTACSDMMEKLGNINLTIVLDTPDIAVASYRLEGLHDNPNSRFTVHDIVPPRHTLSSLKSGLWTITVTAFDAAGTQLGAGTTRINLREGQIVETTLLVVFSQDAPTSSGFTFSAPTRFDSADGRMSGTTAAMEYRLATDPADASYTACSEGTTILGTGTYLIRYAAAHGLRASDPLTVTLPPYQPIQLTIADPTLNTSKIYDGTVEITGSATAGALVGIVGTDDVTISALATYDNKAAGSGKIITVTYTLGGPDAGNYIKPVDTVVIGVIEKRQLTISGTTIAATKIYDRSPLTTVTSPGMLGGVIGSDEVTVAPTASCTDSNVGNDKPVTITYTLGGRDGGNYHSPVDDTTLFSTITKKQLIVSGSEPTSIKQYDGTTSVQLQNNGNLIGVEQGDTVILQPTATYADNVIGSGKQITVSYAINGDTANYLIPENAVFDGGQITQKQLTVSNLALISTKIYDGTTSVANPTFSFDGKVGDEDVRVTATAIYDSPAAGNAKHITVAYSLEGTDKDNYLQPIEPAAAFAGVIDKKQLRANGTELTLTKVYDGTTVAAIMESGTLSGVATGDGLGFNVTATYSSNTAGENKPVTVVYSLTGDAKDNYIKPTDDVRTGVIQKRQLQLTTASAVATTKPYDGTLSAEITRHSSLSGVVSGDSVTLETRAAYVTKTAEIDKSIWVYYSIAGADESNYIKPADVLATGQGVINKRQLGVSGTTITQSKQYDGLRTATVSSPGTLSGFVSGDSVSLMATAAYDTKDAETDKSITVTYTLIGTDKDNYFKPDDWIATQAGVITPKQLGIQILDLPSNKVYDGTTSAVAPTFNLYGKIGSDDVVVTATATYETSTAETGKRIAIVYSLSGADKDNYLKPADILTTASCAIIKKQLTISDPILGTNRKVYDGTTAVQNSVTPGTLSGVLEGDDVTVGAAASYQSANVTTATGGFNPITVVYSLGGLHANNYYPPVNKQLWGAIEKKQLSVIGTAFPASKVYDKSSAITITEPGTLTGMVAGDDVTLGNVTAYYSGTYTMDVGIDKPVTVYYTISGSDAGNYYLNNDTSKTASITAAVLTATVGDYTQTYGEATPTFLVDVTGFVSNDSASNASGYSSPTATAGTTSTSAAGTYTIRITGGSARNYSFNVNDTGTLIIQKPAGAAISGTIDGYYPNSNEGQTIINVTGFSPNQTGIEAEIAYYDTFIPYYPDFAIDSRGRTILYLPSPASTTTKIRFRVKETITHAPGPATEITLAPRPLAIGDYYAGGIVAYIYTSSTLAEETHGLIAAKSDVLPAGIAWSYVLSTQIGTANSIGMGFTNTNSIVTRLGSSASSYAAGKARFYTGGGYSDWFLPSREELVELFKNRMGIGNFITTFESFYWSSSENDMISVPADITRAWAVNFDSTLVNATMYASYQSTALHVRPVRYF
jgi:hypothetical protein